MSVPIPILPGAPEWGVQEASELREFLSKNLGQRLMRQLNFSRTLVTELNNQAKRRIQQDERTGFEACIDEILKLAEPPVNAGPPENHA